MDSFLPVKCQILNRRSMGNLMEEYKDINIKLLSNLNQMWFLPCCTGDVNGARSFFIHTTKPPESLPRCIELSFQEDTMISE